MAVEAFYGTCCLAALTLVLVGAVIVASYLVVHGLIWVALIEAFVLVFVVLLAAAYLHKCFTR